MRPGLPQPWAKSGRSTSLLAARAGRSGQRRLEHAAKPETARLEEPELTEVVPLTVADCRRIAAVRLGGPRVMALLAAVVMLNHLPARFSNAQFRQHVGAPLSVPPGEYTSARMTYDLGRLVRHGLIERITTTRHYRLTADGLRICAFLTKLTERILEPGLARCGRPVPAWKPWEGFDRSIGVLAMRANVAA